MHRGEVGSQTGTGSLSLRFTPEKPGQEGQCQFWFVALEPHSLGVGGAIALVPHGAGGSWGGALPGEPRSRMGAPSLSSLSMKPPWSHDEAVPTSS